VKRLILLAVCVALGAGLALLCVRRRIGGRQHIQLGAQRGQSSLGIDLQRQNPGSKVGVLGATVVLQQYSPPSKRVLTCGERLRG
jgi:hypothetical protein